MNNSIKRAAESDAPFINGLKYGTVEFFRPVVWFYGRLCGLISRK